MQTPPSAKKKKKMEGANFCQYSVNKVKQHITMDTVLNLYCLLIFIQVLLSQLFARQKEEYKTED